MTTSKRSKRKRISEGVRRAWTDPERRERWVASLRDANASPENCHLFSWAMNDRNPKLPGRAFFDKNRCVHLAVPIKISLQIGRVHAKGEVIFSGRPVR